MSRRSRFTAVAVAAVASIPLLVGCGSAAERANQNLSEAADNFEVPRRIVGINTLAATPAEGVLFSVEGFCSYNTEGNVIEAICLVDRASGEVQRTTLGKADNVTFVVTQTGGVEVDLFRPRVILRPTSLIPDYDLSTPSNP